jgi:hypothetical protein
MPLGAIVTEYIEIRTAAGQLAAVLSPEADGLKDCVIDCRLNRECTLTFLLPLGNPKWAEIAPECRIVAGGREFVLLHPDAVDVERDENGRTWGKGTAHESWVLLGKQYPTVTNVPGETPSDLTVTILSGGQGAGGYPAGSAGCALYLLLQGSGWTLDACDVSGTHDLETEKESLLANINKVQELWGGYLVWDSINKKVSLRSESTWQNYTGFQVRYAKNLKNIVRTGNYDLVTRLYPFGENDLDISSVNDGKKYVENFSYTPNVYVGVYVNQDIGDPAELKAKAEEILAKLCRPRYTYRISLIDLRVLPEYAHEDFRVGDLVDVIDEDLGVNVRGRIVRHAYHVFQPWKCELEIGEPEERLAARLAESFDVARFVKDALKPNRTAANLLKGFIDAFTTEINTARGKLVWTGDVLEAIEVNEQGQPTGKRVRLTPGGIGISTDGGQTYRTAVTGGGVLADKVVVNELYALATEDGLSKLTAEGLLTFDRSLVERVRAGRWVENSTEHFGLRVRAQDGQTVLLDDRGVLQTWQEGRTDNVDANYPLVLNVYVPSETRSIKKALLRFRLLAFRAYSTGAAAGGGTVVSAGSVTSEAGGGQTSGDDVWTLVGSARIPADWFSDSAGSHSHTITVYSGGDHTHTGQTSWTIPQVNPDHQHDYRYMNSSGLHNHSASCSTAGSHAHSCPSKHTHSVAAHTHSVPGHSHTIPSHTHSIQYGIYTSTTPLDVTVKINGTDRTSALGGPFNSDQSSLDISPYLGTGWNTIELGSSRLGRIDAAIFIQALMGV